MKKEKSKFLDNYNVKIYYKEPLFCSINGKDPDTLFSGLFDITAGKGLLGRRYKGRYSDGNKIMGRYYEEILKKLEYK